MRPLALSLAMAGLVLGLATKTRADDDLKTVIDKAIKAHGGEEQIAKLKAGRSKAKGTIDVAGMSVAFTQQTAFMLPDKFKDLLQLEINGMQIAVQTVLNGDKISIKAGDMEIKLDDKAKAELRETGHVLEVARLLPLRDKMYTLSALGEAKVEGKPAVGVKVSAKGRRDVNLFFDQKTGLLVKIEHRGADPISGQEFTEERIVLEYQTQEGVPAPKKVLLNRDGKKFLEAEILEFKALEKLDDGEFAIP